jgi:uncharacterized membrane protein
MTTKIHFMNKSEQFRMFLASISKPELFTIFVLLTFGTVAVFMTPVSAGYDEETHLARVWEMSALQFVPNEKLGSELPFPAVYYELSYRRLKLVTAVQPEFLTEYASLPLDAHDYIYGEFETRSVYSPPLLAPQAFVMRYLGRALRLPALTVFYLCRLAGLLSYILLAWLAVRWIPFGKWLMATLAVAPMALLQASIISTDAISNGLALFFIAGCLAISRLEQLTWKEWFQLALLFFVLFWGKVNIVPLALLPFIIIPPSKFGTKSQYALLIFVSVAFLVIEVGGWNILAYSRYHSALEGADPAGQLTYILTHPFDFAGVILKNLWENHPGHFRGWLALYGYDYWPVPQAIYFLYPIAILAALLFRGDQESVINKKERIALLVVFVLSYIATVSSLYVSITPVGSIDIQGIQGRYFFPVMPLLLLALTDLPRSAGVIRSSALILAPVLLSLFLYLGGLILSYHVSCGPQYYRTDLCFQPNYKNFAPEASYSEPVSSRLTLTQEIVPQCDGMTELRVWINSAQADPAQTILFELTDQNDSENASTVEVPNNRLPREGWYTLAFDPDWQSGGKLYTLTISSVGDAGGPRISYSLRPEYTDGKLYENGQNVPQDIIFQYGCIAGLRKMFHGQP